MSTKRPITGLRLHPGDTVALELHIDPSGTTSLRLSERTDDDQSEPIARATAINFPHTEI